MSLGRSLADVLDVSGNPAPLAVLPDKAGDLANPAVRRRAEERAGAGSGDASSPSSTTRTGGVRVGSTTR